MDFDSSASVGVEIVPYRDDLEYLQEELSLVLARCLRLTLERRRNEIPEARESRRPSFVIEDERIEPHLLAERIQSASDSEASLRTMIDARLAVHATEGTFEIGLARLARLHGLTRAEKITLLLAVGPCISRRFEKAYAALEGDRQACLTPEVVLSYLALDTTHRIYARSMFGPRGSLLRGDLIEVSYGGRPSPKDLLSSSIELRSRTFQILLGDQAGIGDELEDLVRIEEPLATFESLVLPESDRRRLLSVLDGRESFLAARKAWGLDRTITYGRGTVILLDGQSGCGKTTCAHAIAHRLGRRVMNVDIARFVAHADGGSFLPALFREARIQGNSQGDALIFFDEAEAIFGARSGNPVAQILLTEIERFEGVVVLATNLPGALDEALWRRILVRVHFSKPDRDARAAIWKSLLPSTIPLAEDVDLDLLAHAFELTGGEIKNAVLVAAATAFYECPDLAVSKITQSMFEAAAKEQSEGRRITRSDFARVEREEFGSKPVKAKRAGFA